MNQVEKIEALQSAYDLLLKKWGSFTHRMSNPIAEILWHAARHIERQLEVEVNELTGRVAN